MRELAQRFGQLGDCLRNLRIHLFAEGQRDDAAICFLDDRREHLLVLLAANDQCVENVLRRPLAQRRENFARLARAQRGDSVADQNEALRIYAGKTLELDPLLFARNAINGGEQTVRKWEVDPNQLEK